MKKNIFTIEHLLTLGLVLLPLISLFSITGITLVILLVISIFVLIFKRKDINFSLSKNEWLFIIILLLHPLSVGISMISNGYWNWPIFDNPVRFLFLIPIYLTLRNYKLSWSYIKYSSYITGFICLIIIIPVQLYILNQPRVGVSVIIFGQLTVIWALFSLFPIKKGDSNLMKISSFLIWITCSLISLVKGSWVAMPITTIISLFWYFKGKRILVYFLLSLLFFIFIFNLKPIKNNIKGAVASIENRNDYKNILSSSQGIRIAMWRSSYYIMNKNNILLGVGGNVKSIENAMRYQFLNNEKLPKQLHNYPSITHFHNQFIHTLVSRGVLGLLSLLLFILFPLYFYFRNLKNEEVRNLCLLGIILNVSYFIFSLPDTPLIREASSGTWSIMQVVIFSQVIYHKRKINEKSI